MEEEEKENPQIVDPHDHDENHSYVSHDSS